jgi:fumarate reductase subunit D
MAPIQGTVVPKFDPKDVQDHKFIAALSYLGILCLIPLLAVRSSRFTQEHAKQGFLLFIAWVIVMALFQTSVIGRLIDVAFLLVDLMAIIKCVQGNFWEIPLIGPLRSKINF